MWALYKRLRHTHGYGVHSPLAYRLVTNVLTPRRGYGWYGYEDIEATMRRNAHTGEVGRHKEKMAKLILRIVGTLDIRGVWLSPYYTKGEREVYISALRAARRDIRIYGGKRPDRNSVMVIAPKAGVLADDTLYILEEGKIVMLTDTTPEGIGEISEYLEKRGDGGIALEGRRRALYIMNGGKLLHRYTIL